MRFFFSIAIFFYFFLFPIIFTTITHGTIFEIHNNCSDTVWAAAIPGGGRQLNTSQSWIMNLKHNIPQQGQIWARTNCSFSKSGHGTCDSGDCNGQLQCKSNGTSPYTLVGYSLNQINNDRNFVHLSLVNGFNLGMDIIPILSESDDSSREIRCRADINTNCPDDLKVSGGCKDPCAAYDVCSGPTPETNFFKQSCPDAYSYPSEQDHAINYSYPRTTNYRIVFCPGEAILRHNYITYKALQPNRPACNSSNRSYTSNCLPPTPHPPPP
ncbi:hypothetical protein AQUCO_02300210v1 [Aquilegia coerulea]|uniref:Thaumatin-like protein n=1 Tax=Aquilegia coerulea TaxID=218851 RepID=A0A2G5DCM7_AQUCA|nr:hypothetical protein AQUCO_02300210v1 [Aquilegia coerulea]